MTKDQDRKICPCCNRVMPRNPGGRPGRKPAPVTIRGVEYQSATHAAEALGVSLDTVRWARANRKLETVGLGGGFLTPEARKQQQEATKKEILIDGVSFLGWKEAEHITGLGRQTLLKRGAKVLKQRAAKDKGK